MSDPELAAAEDRLARMALGLPLDDGRATLLARDIGRVLEQSQARRSGGVVGALLLLSELREAMGTIRTANPAWFADVDDAPTAADNCKRLLALIEQGLVSLGQYLEGAGDA